MRFVVHLMQEVGHEQTTRQPRRSDTNYDDDIGRLAGITGDTAKQYAQRGDYD